MPVIEPMLSAKTKNYESLFDGREYFISPKIDGIRAISNEGIAQSRSGKELRNEYIQKLFKTLPSNLDGELLSKEVMPNITFSSYTEGIMKIKGDLPSLTYYVFDYIDDTMTAEERFNKLLTLKLPSFCKIVPQIKIKDFVSMESLEKEFLDIGFEGAMLKDCKGTYKHGSSTIKEKKLIKVKRFDDAEAIIIGFEELTINNNEQEENEFGRSKRSTKMENLIPANTLGSLKVKKIDSDIQFNIGSGFNAATRKLIWNNKKEYLGKIVKYKHFVQGAQVKPRLPIYLGIRDEIDL